MRRARSPSKYGNVRVAGFDSKRELRYERRLQALTRATDPRERVVRWQRQKVYELIPPQDGERAVTYRADFNVHYADGREEVVDVKSDFTRRLAVYVIKRKLMLWRHGIRIIEA